MTRLILINILFLTLFSQTGIQYKRSYVNKDLLRQLHTSIANADSVEFDSIMSKLWKNSSNPEQNIPVYYNFDIDYDDLPDICIYYEVGTDTINWNNQNISFLKTTFGKLQYDLDNFYVHISKPKEYDYLLKESKLYLDVNNSSELIFDYSSESNISSAIGISEFHKFYPTVQLFGKTYSNIYEFIFRPSDSYYDSPFVLWFDFKYNLIRIDAEGYGILKDSN